MSVGIQLYVAARVCLRDVATKPVPPQATPRYNNSIVEDMHFLSNLELMHSALKARAALSAAQRAWMPCDIQHGCIGVAIGLSCVLTRWTGAGDAPLAIAHSIPCRTAACGKARCIGKASTA